MPLGVIMTSYYGHIYQESRQCHVVWFADFPEVTITGFTDTEAKKNAARIIRYQLGEVGNFPIASLRGTACALGGRNGRDVVYDSELNVIEELPFLSLRPLPI